MAYADRVLETTATTGTGTLTLDGAVTGYRAFSTFSSGERVRYGIAGTSEWEVGEGTYTASTLTRDNVFSSSNSGALVSFSSGTKTVWCDLPAAAVADLGMTLAIKNLNIPN